MTGARGGENGPRVARIGDRMMHDVAEEMRAREFPRAARGVTGKRPQALRVAINRVVFRAGAATVFRVEAMGSSLQRNATPSVRFRQAEA
jgi:hypothetical protein